MIWGQLTWIMFHKLNLRWSFLILPSFHKYVFEFHETCSQGLSSITNQVLNKFQVAKSRSEVFWGQLIYIITLTFVFFFYIVPKRSVGLRGSTPHVPWTQFFTKSECCHDSSHNAGETANGISLVSTLAMYPCENLLLV